MTPRKVLFWIHLVTGLLAGIVIFVMAVTGVLLAYERQMVGSADRSVRVLPPVFTQHVPLSRLVPKLRDQQGAMPMTVVMHHETDAPWLFTFGRSRTLFVNPYTGDVTGEASPRFRAFFATVEDIHRWLGGSGRARNAGRAVTGACNLLFLLLVCTGPFLWWPKEWTSARVRQVIFFRGGLSGRALFWNWHNVLGIWCAVPLLLIVATGVVMSYQWANDLLYRLTGNEPPRPQAFLVADNPGNRPGDRLHRPGEHSHEGLQFDVLDRALERGAQQIPDWKTMTVRLPAVPSAPMLVTLDVGNGGRPDQRTQLTVSPQTGEIIRSEPFSSYNLGRRLRMWARFTHTGETGGVLGQTIAAFAAAAASLLVVSGWVLALRRLFAWKKSSCHESELAAQRAD